MLTVFFVTAAQTQPGKAKKPLLGKGIISAVSSTEEGYLYEIYDATGEIYWVPEADLYINYEEAKNVFENCCFPPPPAEEQA